MSTPLFVPGGNPLMQQQHMKYAGTYGGRKGQRFAFCIPRFAFRVSHSALRFQWVEPMWVGFPTP